MANRKWTDPTKLLSGGRGGSYSMIGPGRSKTAILGSVATPPSGEFASMQPSSEPPFSADVGTDSITAAMSRGPAIERRTASTVGGGPGRESQDFQTPDMEMDFGEDFMGGLRQPAGSGMPGAFNPMVGMPGSMGMPGPVGMPGGSQGTTAYGGSSGPMVPQEIKGNLPAIRDWKKSGLPFDQWIQTVGASPWF